MGVVLQGISGFPSLCSPLTLRGRWPVFSHGDSFPISPKTPSTPRRPYVHKIHVCCYGDSCGSRWDGEEEFGAVAGLGSRGGLWGWVINLQGESSAEWGWYLTLRVEPIEGIDIYMDWWGRQEKGVITRIVVNSNREWPWGATKRSTECTKAWKETRG